MGLKYSDLSFEKGTGNYHISQEKYDAIKEKEGIGKNLNLSLLFTEMI